jgi:hypothetical protein
MRKQSSKSTKASVRLIAVLVLIGSAGLAGTVAVVPGAARADTAPAEGPGVLDARMASQLLANYGYSKISDLTRDGDVWKGTAIKDGVSRSIQVHALTGAVLEAAPGK